MNEIRVYMNGLRYRLQFKEHKKPIYKDIRLYIYLLGLLAMFFIFSCAFAQDVNLNIIAKIESSNNPLAYNRASGARGLYQITPICLKDYNQVNRANMALSDLFVPSKAKIVANWYLNARIPSLMARMGLKDTIANRLWAYNAGIGLLKRGIMPKETRDYIKKYLKEVV